MTKKSEGLFRREDIECPHCGVVHSDYQVTEKGVHLTAHCAHCGRYIKHVSHSDKYGTEEQQRIIWDKTGGRCFYCGAALRPYDKRGKMKLTVDHFQPQSRGGEHTIDNLVPSCKSCNSQKKDLLIGEYRQLLMRQNSTRTHVFFFEILEYGPTHIKDLIKKLYS